MGSKKIKNSDNYRGGKGEVSKGQLSLIIFFVPNACENLHVKCEFEPWLKGPFFGGLSHGSKPNN